MGNDESRQAYIERSADVMVESGMPRMPSRVLSALLATDSGRLTSAELARMLTISPAAVSGAIRYLLQVDLVKRERDPGSRRDHYRVLDEVWQEAVFNRDKVLERWETNLSEGVEVLGPDTPAGARLAESVRMFQFLRRELKGTQERWIAERDARPAGGGSEGPSGTSAKPAHPAGDH